ncbi:hypothetical protein [Candidatus Contubernalis alkaliaceticus]|uniref:hypothetical protein n=1 Tax=Candidatus Contubernalis alkaliaceticus TaxID=338645 RepID=UPI001F4BE560|nr:hypothetical protein [Candidatus Contubernalis alkalaceticus]UNC92635.1 hypothetical protein HUE98_11325 [Candidatus Contubernalis alkalaceticus]
MFAKSIKLYLISFVFIIYSNIIVNQPPLLRHEIILEITISIAYLSSWFYYGYKLCEGFLNGIKIGGIAAGIGVILSCISKILNCSNTTPWVAPLTGIIRVIPENRSYYSIVIGTFVIISLLTAIGSQMGLKKNQKNAFGEP